jgi:pimeloyl-ACP methyl ester carboxylesterase
LPWRSSRRTPNLVGEDEGELGKKTPSILTKTDGAIKKTPDEFAYLNPADFPKLFAPDLPRERAEFSALSQVLAAAKVFATPLTVAAWKTKPSWGIVAGNDQIINPDLERWYYARAKSHTTEIKGASHSVYESHPEEVAAVIADAARNAQNGQAFEKQ